MTRPGMTILELLLSLALLSGLTIACVSWTTAATRALTDQGGDAAWERGAESVLAYIDDLLAADDRSADRSRETWRVQAEAQRLTLRSRRVVADESGTPALANAIELAAADGSLVATFHGLEDGRIAQRPLLGRMASLDVTVSEIDRTSVRLVVTLRGERGAHAERAWTLAAGDLR